MSIEHTSNDLTQEVANDGFIFFKKFWKTYIQFLPFFLVIIVLVFPLLRMFFSHHRAKLPDFSLEKLMSNNLQKEYETWFNEHNSLKARFTKINNQLYYSLFLRSLMSSPSVVIGKQKYLYEQIYIEQYTNSNKTPYTQQQFDKWAVNLQELSDFFSKRGQKFIYLITPSKAAFYPEYIPDSYKKIITNPRPDYFLKIEALKKTRIPYIDGSELMLSHKQKSYGHLLFPQGGIHWTMLGAALTAEKIIDLIAQQTQRSLPPLSFSYIASTIPIGVDKDLLEFCKLYFPEHYDVPYVTFKANKKPYPLKLAIIGGSFTHFFRDMFIESNYFSKLDQYYYLILNHHQFSKGKQIEIPINREESASYQDILAADVVILEESEMLPFSNHFKEFYLRILGKALVE